MGNNAEIRIATVKANGNRYIVQAIDFSANLVRVWGEVHAYNGVGTKHASSKKFKLDAVTITNNVTKNAALVMELFAQAKANLRRDGYRIIGNEIVPPPAGVDPLSVVEAAGQLGIDLNTATGDEYRTIVALVQGQ